jgi:hypothetical protein
LNISLADERSSSAPPRVIVDVAAGGDAEAADAALICAHQPMSLIAA